MSIKRQRSLSCSNDDDDGEEIQQRRMNGETTDDATTALVGELRKELNSLQRVSHRLVVTDDSALTNVLNGLLPRLFHRVTLHDNAQKQKNAESYRDLPVVKELYDNIHSQLMQILSHALTRVKASNQMELPCLSLLQHLVIQDTDGLMIIHETVPQITFRLMIPFLKIGIPRMKPPKTSSSSSSSSSIQQLLSYLIVLLGSPEHQVAVTPLFCMALEQWCGTGTSFDPDIMGESTRTLLCQRPTLANAVYQVVLDVLLWSPTSTGTTTNTSSPSSSSLPPPGLSKLSQQRCPSPVSKNMRKSMLLAIVPNQRFRILWDTPANIARAMILWVVGCSCCSNSDDGLGGNGSTTATAVGTAVLQKYVTRQSQSSRSDSGLGDPEIVGSELLGLVLGLGEGMAKRRPVTENAAVFIVQFVTTHVIPNISLFKTSTQATTSSNDNNKNNQDGQNLKPETQAQTPLVIQKVWSLALTVVENTLIASSTLTNRSATKLAVAVAQLTSALAVRLVQQHNAQDDEECNNMNTTVVNNLQAKCRIVASSVLSSSVASLGTNWSNSRNTRIYDVAGEQALNVREVCYEILAVLARSSTAETTVLPMETVSMLFQCTTYEEERLRTKAVAALDAVLVAYQRLCCRTLPPCSTDIAKLRDTAAATKTTSDGTSASVHGESENNPWLNNQTAETMDVREEKSIQKTTNASLAKSLLPLLWSAAESHRPKASRVAAARWASNVLKHIDLVKACHLLCYLAGDTDVTVARIAKEEGLGLSLTFSETIGVNEEEMIMSLVKSSVDLHDQRQVPSFGEITDVLFVADTETAATTQAYTWRIQRFQDFSVQGKAASLRFALICLLSDLYDGSDTSIGMFLSAITETLLLFLEKSSGISGKGSSEQTNVCVDLLDESAACLLATISSSKHARLLISPGIDEEDNVKAKLAPAFGLEEIENLVMRANSSLARRHLAAAFGKILQDVWSTMSCDDFVKWIEQSRLHKTLESCLDNMQGLETTTKPTSRLHGSLFLGAHVMRAFRCSAARFPCQNASESMLHKTWKQCNDTLVSLGKALSHTDEQIGSASADCLSIAFSYESDDALEFDSRLYDSARNVLTMLSAALKKFGHGDFVDPQRSTRIARAAGVCLAATTIGSSIDRTEHVKIGSCRLECASSLVEILGSASYRKSEEISIAVGEALGEYADAYSPMNVVWTCPDPFEWPVDFSEEYAKQLPPHDHTVFVLLRSISTSTDPHKKTACAPALLAVVARCARKANSDRGHTRSLTKTVLSHLEEIQTVFISLLSYPKSKQFIRECCCIGLVACRGLVQVNQPGDVSVYQSLDEMNSRLLRAFGQTTQYGGSVLMETEEQAEMRRRNGGYSLSENTENELREAGGAAGIGEAALGAYREMAAASVLLRRHDVFYSLLLLSVSHPYWSSSEARHRYSSRSLLGECLFLDHECTAFDFRKALQPHLAKLVPRILRACHDPNKQTREQMTSLWNGLTGGGPEGRQVITNHFIPTIDTLIEESSSKLWRARVGACGAIADVIIGRSWKDLGGGEAVLNDDEVYEKPTGKESAGVRFLRLWRVAYRAMDDMHGSVRDVGEQLARSMRALTIRLCDPAVDQKQDERNIFHGALKVRDHDATAAAATSLRWLIRRGLNQTSQEVVGICISTLVEVIGVVKPRILEPSLPDLIRSLLLGMSGLEPAALNYLQLRSNDQEGLERIRLQLVQSGPLAKAVQKCLELLPNVGIETQHSVVSELDAALRQSAGFATRAATADAVSALCTACPNAFKFSNASASNPAVRLMRAFYFASERERGASARDKMIHALGNLAALCPASSVRSLALRACERYRSSTGNNEDPESRRSAAAALRTIASRASNQFSDGGDGDIWFQRVLPTAYLGRRDSDLKTASLWNEVWVEGGSSAKHTASTESAGYLGTKLEENMLPALVSECVLALRDVSWSRRRAGASAIIDLCSAGILAPVQNSQVAGISYNYSGPKACLRARRRAESSKAALVECIRLLIKPRFWTGKAEVMIAATKVASQWVSMSHQGAEDAQNHLLGFEGSSSACHWLPISISSTSSNIDDLFLGDRRFAPAKTDEELNLIEDDQVLAKETETCLDCSGSIDIEFDDDDIIVPIENTSAPVENISETVSLVGLCRLLCDNALLRGVSLNSLSDDRLSYRSTAFSCLKELLSSMHTGLSAQKKIIYKAISPSLIFLLDTQGLKSDPGKRTPPVLVAGAIACLGACFWDNIGSERVDNTEPKELTMRIKDACGKLQPAWTVREAALLCLGALVVKCDVESLCHHSMLAQMVEAANQSLTDRKFWRVRFAGLKLVESLTSRVGSNDKILEAVLPHKEKMLDLSRSGLKDSEAQVTALSTKIIGDMTWWP